MILAAPAARAGDVVGRGSLGAALGLMRWVADDETSRDAQFRPILNGVFRYAFTPALEAQIQSGAGWGAYTLRGDTVTVVIPTTIGINYRFNPAARTVFRAGGGGGMYIWRVQQKGKVSQYISPAGDPAQIVEDREGADIGAYGEIGLDRFMNEHVTVSADLAYHQIFSSNERLTDGFKDNDAFVAARVGVHYYFSLTR
jgi:hypothetical protein